MMSARAAIAVLVLACTTGAAWLARAAQTAADSRQKNAVAELVQRCSVQMVKDSCQVMNTPAPSSAAVRLFIAGVGEVDAAAFAALRSWGDSMCQELGAQCAADFEGASCRIARALYAAAAQ